MEITKEEANVIIDAYKKDSKKLDTQSLFFSRKELEGILTDDCIGIKIYLGQETFNDDSGDYVGVQLVAGRVTASDKTGMNYVEKSGIPPCPKFCGTN